MTNIRYFCRGCDGYVADKLVYYEGKKVVTSHRCKKPSIFPQTLHPALSPES